MSASMPDPLGIPPLESLAAQFGSPPESARRRRSAPPPLRRSILLASILILIATPGCASSRMRSFLDPDFSDHRYKNILIAARFENLDQRADAEDIFLQQFAKIDAQVTRSVEVLLPTREYDDREFFEILDGREIDAVVLVWETDYWEEEEYSAQTSMSHTSGTLSASTYQHGGYATTHGSVHGTTHTQTWGGHPVRKPRMRHKIELYDVASRRLAWTGGSLTKGSAYAGFKDLMHALAKETRGELLQQGLLLATGRRGARSGSAP